MVRRTSFLALFFGFAALGATCRGNEAQTAGAQSASPSHTAGSGASVAHTNRAQPETSVPRIAVTEIPGVDLALLPPSVRTDALRMLNETSCYCGCARTVASCLANPKDCTCVRCSERVASFILRELGNEGSVADVESQLLEGFSEGYNGKPVEFELRDRAIAGTTDASFTLVEFADFQCPHCAAAFEVLKDVIEKRKNVRLAYFYFPLSHGGERSIRAAEAAEEARLQGKFWPMAELLFQNQYALEEENLFRYAKQIGLDLDRFTAALRANAHRERVMEDKRLGESLGVDYTPMIFVNGRKFGLARTTDNVNMRLDMERERGTCD